MSCSTGPRTTYDNGFLGLWLPRGVSAHLATDYGGISGTAAITASGRGPHLPHHHGAHPTCLSAYRPGHPAGCICRTTIARQVEANIRQMGAAICKSAPRRPPLVAEHQGVELVGSEAALSPEPTDQ
ncbi:hypothetical protein [Dietzia lutea]|uniref:hypothetical protein n=1 Tax=Dietzia lutea TaxID=546160 RepID=UPI00399A0E8A